MSDNRASRRAAEAREKMERNSGRVKNAVEAAKTALEQAERLRQLLFACVRPQGRIRISKADMDALSEDDRVDYLRQENGDVILQYTSGGTGGESP